MSKRPNLLFIVNDHQAHFGHGVNGVGPIHPNFDKLAAEGACFTQNFSVTPMCGPARRTFLTGLYPHTHGQIHNENDPPYRNEVYLDTLAENGYRNFVYGKWHAGPGCAYDHHCDGLSQQGYGNPYNMPEYAAFCKKRGLPRARHYVEYAFSHDAYTMNRYFKKLKAGALYQCEDFFSGEHAVGITVTPKETHESFYLANLACEKLEELAREQSDQPFALRVDFWGPHQPFFPTKEFADLFNPDDIQPPPSFFDDLSDKPDALKTEASRPIGDGEHLILPNPLPWKTWQLILARAYGHEAMIDAAGGMIIDKLRELGLDENTIIIWTTDHGDALACHGGHFDKDSHMAMEVINTPLAVAWPGHIRPGTICNHFTCTCDVPVTLLDAAGLRFSERVDGRSLLDTLEGKNLRESLMLETYGHGYGTTILGRTVLMGGWKYTCTENDLDELYDHNIDPYEMKNLAALPEYAEKRAQMRTELRRLQAESCDPVPLESICAD